MIISGLCRLLPVRHGNDAWLDGVKWLIHRCFLVHSSAAGHLRGSSVLNDHGVPSYPHVISAAQARALGLSHHAVRHRLQRGLWQPMMRGIYVTHAGPVTADDWDRAALLFARTPVP